MLIDVPAAKRLLLLPSVVQFRYILPSNPTVTHQDVSVVVAPRPHTACRRDQSTLRASNRMLISPVARNAGLSGVDTYPPSPFTPSPLNRSEGTPTSGSSMSTDTRHGVPRTTFGWNGDVALSGVRAPSALSNVNSTVVGCVRDASFARPRLMVMFCGTSRSDTSVHS